MGTPRGKPRPPLSAAQKELAAGSVRLVHLALQRYGTAGLEYDDAAQEGCRGMMDAARNYDPAQGKWSGYAIRGAVMAVRTAGKIRRNRRPAGATPLEAATRPDDPALRLDLEAALRRLSARDAALLREHHLRGLSLDEIARSAGQRPGTVHERARAARRRLRAVLAAWARPCDAGAAAVRGEG